MASTAGEWIRGTLLEFVAGEHAFIRLASGGERRYPWANIRRHRNLLPPGMRVSVQAPAAAPDHVEPDRDDAYRRERSLTASIDPDGQPLRAQDWLHPVPARRPRP